MRTINRKFIYCVFFTSIACSSCIKHISPYNPSNPSRYKVIYNPEGLVVDKTGNIYFTNGNSNILKVNTSGTISSIAGTDTVLGCTGNGGLATAARFDELEGICTDQSGNIYFADEGCNYIQKINTSTGTLTAFAGIGISGYNGDGGSATTASLYFPEDVCVDTLGNLYITDAGNSRIRKVNGTTGVITTIAGNGTAGFSGDGGAATAAEINFPMSIAIDNLMNVYISDGVSENMRIRKINANTGIITTIAGNGQLAFNGDNIPATAAAIAPIFIKLDTANNIYFSDAYNLRIRKIDTKTGIITTIAGNGNPGSSVNGILASAAQFTDPSGLAFDIFGNLYIADQGNNNIRKITASTGIITTVAHN